MEPSNGAGRLRSVFVLDDDPEILNYMKIALGEPAEDDEGAERFDVRVFDDPYDFMAAVNNPEAGRRLVLAVIDYLLEGSINGLMVSYQLAREWPDIAQIYCTSHANSRVKELLIKCKACARGLIEKPILNLSQVYRDAEEVLANRDEFFSRFVYRESRPPFIVPRVSRPRQSLERRKGPRPSGESAPPSQD